jgi:hypothetical protein
MHMGLKAPTADLDPIWIQLGKNRKNKKSLTGILERKYGGVVAGQLDPVVNFPN